MPSLWRLGIALTATLLPCLVRATTPYAEIERGKVTYYFADGTKGATNTFPWDATFTITREWKVEAHTSGFSLEGLVGCDLVGLEFSPWAGIRPAHIWNLGVDFGFDRHNITIGVDWLWRDIVFGPNLNQPFDLGPTTWGAKAAFQF